MILNNYLADIKSRCSDGPFLRPDYSRYSFSQIPSLIENILGVDNNVHPFADIVFRHIKRKPQKVILLLIDGFGYNQFLKYAERYLFLNRLIERGVLMPLTALFPSTTAASITTINSGLTPQEHGLIEWHLYLDEIDKTIESLPFRPLVKNATDDQLTEDGVDPAILFNGQSIHHRLSDNKIASYVVLHKAYVNSTYSARVYQTGATIIPFNSSSDMAVLLRHKLSAVKSRSYFYVYWGGLDHMSHTYEPHSDQYLAELNSLSHLLQSELLDKIDQETAKDTVLLVTADHGHIPMYPDETIYINSFPEVVDALAVSPAGNKILPWGSPRDVFLRVKEEQLDKMIDTLIKRLAGKAAVLKSQEEADRGLFGTGCEHPQFRKRIGNILILPYENHTVWYQYPGLDKFNKRGMHGGLTPEEMVIPLLFVSLSDLL